jgi:hypothetical protein
MDFENDEMLDQLALDIDTELLKWIHTFEIPALALSAVILARLVWLAKLGNYEKDLVQLLEHPRTMLDKEETNKVVH